MELHFTRDAAVGRRGALLPCRNGRLGRGESSRLSVSGVRRRGAVQHVRGDHPDVLLDVPDVLLHVVDVLRDAGVRFPVLGAHVIYAPVPFTSALHHAGERNSGDLEHGFRRSGMLVGA